MDANHGMNLNADGNVSVHPIEPALSFVIQPWRAIFHCSKMGKRDKEKKKAKKLRKAKSLGELTASKTKEEQLQELNSEPLPTSQDDVEASGDDDNSALGSKSVT